MLLYSIIMFAVAILFMVISLSIYKGNTNLIHDYHQTKVKDKEAYGKAFGKALAVTGLAPLFSGLLGLFGDSKPLALISVSAFAIFFCVGFACICVVQKKYNGSMF